MRQYRNIIFDLGGVLVTLHKQRSVEAFQKIGAHDVAKYVDEHRTEDFFHDLEIGNIGEAQFCEAIRQRIGIGVTDEQVRWAWNQLLGEISDEKKRRLIELRRNHRLFLLSNTNVIHWTLCTEKLFLLDGMGEKDYFERSFLSYEMHLAKPDHDIYEEVIRQADIRPDETLFIDDSQKNLDGAADIGIGTYLAHDDNWLDDIR